MNPDKEYNKYFRRCEELSRYWHSADEQPYGINSSKHGTYLVTSPVLQFIFFNGITFGTYRPGAEGKGTWFIIANGELIEHEVTHWREIPASPNKAPKYETVKDEVEALMARLKR